MSSEVSWITFAENSPEVKTAVHFFPYCGSISATYPVSITLTVFAADFETVEVTMDGARLSQPEGIMLDQVFPALLGDYTGLYGVRVKISPSENQELDLSSSECITELYTPDGVVRFPAKVINYNDGKPINGLCIKKDEENSALITINFSENQTQNSLPAGVTDKSALANQLEAYAVEEAAFAKDFIATGTEQNTSQGKILAKNYSFYPGPNLTYFSINRSLQHSYPVSVNTL